MILTRSHRAINLNHAFEKYRKLLFAEVNVSNSPAIHLYEKNGFKCTSIKENYYHNGTSAYYMQRPTIVE